MKPFSGVGNHTMFATHEKYRGSCTTLLCCANDGSSYPQIWQTVQFLGLGVATSRAATSACSAATLPSNFSAVTPVAIRVLV